jgi:hypothetical protein
MYTMSAKSRFYECYNSTYSDHCALQRYLLSYETPTCERELTKLENLKTPNNMKTMANAPCLVTRIQVLYSV